MNRGEGNETARSNGGSKRLRPYAWLMRLNAKEDKIELTEGLSNGRV
jgi:hypothetical protein